MAHCGGMGLQRERINAGAAARRLRSLEEPGDVDVRRAGRSSAVDAGRTGRLTPPRPPIPPRAGRRGAGKISIGELAGVRPGDTDVTVEHRMRRDAPRLRFTPGHALAAMLLLVAVTCASLTLLVRQSLNYATVGQSASRGTVRPYEGYAGGVGCNVRCDATARGHGATITAGTADVERIAGTAGHGREGYAHQPQYGHIGGT